MKNSYLDNENIELNFLFWKGEILQVMYWLYGEALDQKVSENQLAVLLNISVNDIIHHLDKLILEDMIIRSKADEVVSYELTESGRKEAGLHFATAFDGMQKAGHGECGPDCPFCYGDNGEKLENCVHDCAVNHVH